MDLRLLCVLSLFCWVFGWVSPRFQSKSFSATRPSLSPLKCEERQLAPWDISSISLDTTSRKPIIFLDVDGVINCHCGVPWPDQKTKQVRGFSISYSPTIVESFNRFVRDGLAEIRWLTAWGYHAPEKLAPQLGLDPFPTARDAKWDPPKGVVAKAIAEACPGRPIAWVDDELTRYASRDIEFWKERPKTLLIKPDGHLTKDEMTTLEEFLQDHKV